MDTQTTTQLAQLKEYTKVVADTADFDVMADYKPQDATTNPTLVMKALKTGNYEHLFDKAIKDCSALSIGENDRIQHTADYLLTLFGAEILKIVPGRVSTEVDARLSFNKEGTIQKARKLINLYQRLGIERERILIKVASTWEGAEAARELQMEEINCNMTLMFSLPQAVICAEAGATLISPFVGRIYDWYKKNDGRDYEGDEDPGVQSVREIYTYYKKFGYKTEIMGASFRNKGQILSLTGCDLLTISPELLKELEGSSEKLERKLSAEEAKASDVKKVSFDEKSFRYALNENAMATEKLAQGIRVFAQDGMKLQEKIAEKL